MTRLFREAMRQMRRRDPQVREDGFHSLLPFVADHVDDLLTEFRAERDDHGLRCWLLELIVEARSLRAFGVFVEQLHGPDEDLRTIAVRGLRCLDTNASRRLLWQWRQDSALQAPASTRWIPQ